MAPRGVAGRGPGPRAANRATTQGRAPLPAPRYSRQNPMSTGTLRVAELEFTTARSDTRRRST